MQFYICVVVEHANEHIYFCLLSYSLIFVLLDKYILTVLRTRFSSLKLCAVGTFEKSQNDSLP